MNRRANGVQTDRQNYIQTDRVNCLAPKNLTIIKGIMKLQNVKNA